MLNDILKRATNLHSINVRSDKFFRFPIWNLYLALSFRK